MRDYRTSRVELGRAKLINAKVHFIMVDPR
nr:MAG TPA: hypothetical protein [Caudoviricetes sp.]